LPRPLRILYASDLHLGHWWTASVPDQLADAARAGAPDVILLGGDLVDRRTALPRLRAAVAELVSIAPVHAIPGNHDARAGIAAVRAAIESAGGAWLAERSLKAGVQIDGTLGPVSTKVPRILCAHSPGIFPQAVAAGYRLVLAGHLHGGQCVLATYRDRLYPAFWLCRWHCLRSTDHDSTLLVSRGAADTFPVRFNCPREVLLCDIL
jgi:predicted MPP superfamily phosphohydrolase